MASHSNVLVYHGPLQIATFGEWLAIYFHHSVLARSGTKKLIIQEALQLIDRRTNRYKL